MGPGLPARTGRPTGDRPRSGRACTGIAAQGTPSQGRGVVLGPAHEAILRLLAEGQTDQSIARTLGITTPTVTRTISEIYELLGVESRCQAGVAAKELGIV